MNFIKITDTSRIDRLINTECIIQIYKIRGSWSTDIYAIVISGGGENCLYVDHSNAKLIFNAIGVSLQERGLKRNIEAEETYNGPVLQETEKADEVIGLWIHRK